MQKTSKQRIQLNCDLGESYGAWTMGNDAAIMPLIDSANVACGFHGGDPLTLVNTLTMARDNKVEVGAHPSYPDLAGFGRRSMQIADDELEALLLYQISALDGLARSAGWQLSYVKPHGALYNDMMKQPHIMASVFNAVSRFPTPLKVMIQATENWQAHQKIAEGYQISLVFEAFADRAYDDDGFLVPRNQSGAVLDETAMLAQARHLFELGAIIAQSGKSLDLKVDSLCVHGDTPDALEGLQKIRDLRDSLS